MKGRAAICLSLVSTGALLSGCSGSAPIGSAVAVAPPTPLALAQAMLDARSRAMLGRDAVAFRATVSPSANEAERRSQLSAFAAAAALPFRSWSLQIAAQADQPPALGRWVVLASLRYALAGYDGAAVSLPRTLALSRSATGWTVAADTQLDAPWDFGPLVVKAGAHSLVIAAAARATAVGRVHALAEAAVPVVSRDWGGDWSQKVVVVIPATVAQLEAEVGTTGDLSPLAAVQAVELVGSRSAAGDRVLLNPDVFLDATSALGQRVVLTHEITHVASAAATTPGVPLWLVEGLADTVGFATTTLSPARGAPELASSVRSGKLPGALPTDADFAATSANLVAAYEQAWLACRLIEARTGWRTLVAFYRAVGRGQSVALAFEDVLHTTLRRFTRAWLASLRAELR